MFACYNVVASDQRLGIAGIAGTIMYGAQMGSQHLSPDVTEPLRFDPRIWLEIDHIT